MRYSSTAILIAMLCIGCDQLNSTTTDTTTRPVSSKTGVDRDNTAVNKRDRNSDLKTPIDQNENKTVESNFPGSKID